MSLSPGTRLGQRHAIASRVRRKPWHSEEKDRGARLGSGLAFVCGAIGLLAGLTEQTWRLGVTGWFALGGLLAILAVFALVEGLVAAQRSP